MVKALKLKDLGKLESHSTEMSRCLSDLITFFRGNPEMQQKLEKVGLSLY